MKTRRQPGERGSVATIVAVLLGGGVLLGFLALSVDVGNLMWERRQLQSSADAAATSLAQSCYGSAGSNCSSTSDNLADLVDSNAADDAAGIESVCATNMPGSPLGACPVGTGAYADCSPLPGVYASMSGLPYVEVRTKTQTAVAGGRTNSLTNFVAGALGSPTAAVGACARAAVGVPGAGVADLPITISGCEWEAATGGTIGGGGGTYYTSPVPTSSSPKGYGAGGQPAWPPGPTSTSSPREVVIFVQNPPGGHTLPSTCPNWQGHALPGGFGILETQSGDPCRFIEYSHHWMHTSPGSSTGCNLSNLVGKVVNIPVFDCTANGSASPGVAPPVGTCADGAGNNAWYHRAGYAAFYLSGYRATTTGSIPNRVPSVNPNNTTPPGQDPCANSETCVSGWFVTDSLSTTTITGPPGGGGYFGTWGVVLAG